MILTKTAFLILSFLGSSTSVWCAGPVLTPEQIQRAMTEGRRYKTVDKFLEKGLKGRRVKLAGAMAKDGISKYATFFNDWYAVAAESAAANQQMRDLNASDVEAHGYLHAFVEVHARGSIPTSKLNRRYREQRAHLVLKVGNRTIQPVVKTMINKSDQSVGMILAGVESGKMTLDFAFDVAPEDLTAPVEIILIDGDGNRHSQEADLKGILEVD